MKITEWVFLYMKYDWPISKYFDGTFCWLWTSYFWRVFCLQWKVYIDIFFSSNTTPTSPLLEEAGCGLLNALGSSSSPTFSSSLKLLVGSRHHFDLVSIDLSQNGNSDSTRILTLASGSSTGAISATEVSKFTWYYTRLIRIGRRCLFDYSFINSLNEGRCGRRSSDFGSS